MSEHSAHQGPKGNAAKADDAARSPASEPPLSLDATDLEEIDLDLTQEQQSRIAVLAARLKAVDYYELLEIPRSADRKLIKRAYNAQAKEFHPDRFFRKRLGSFGPTIHAIFVGLTKAHDVLCSPEQRALYDSALRAQRVSLIDALLEEAAVDMSGASSAALREEIELCEPIVVRSTPPQRG